MISRGIYKSASHTVKQVMIMTDVQQLKMKKLAWVLVGFLVSGAICGLVLKNTPASESRVDLLRIYIVSRAGGISASDVFFQTMKKSLRTALLWGCACMSRPLYVLGCAALALEGFSFSYTLLSILRLGGSGTWLIVLCMFLPQNLLLWCIFLFMGLFTARVLAENSLQKEQVTSRYVLLMFCCLALCILVSLLHTVFTLKLMKLLPVAV